ncbi:MAG: 50S ribosomal protein L15e [Candidatus Anstonellaceae archaeon]
MGVYKYIKETFQKEYAQRSKEYRDRLTEWRAQGTVMKLEKPTNLARARVLGYKAKQGYLVVRVKIKKGKRKRPTPAGGRKPAKNVLFVSPGISKRLQAEQKAARKYPNMEVLNSYWVGEDGQLVYYEVILIDRDRYKIRRGRVYRGLTSAAKKVRGLR